MFQEIRGQKRSNYKVLLIDGNVDQLDSLLTGFEILDQRLEKNFDVSYRLCNRSDLALELLQEELVHVIVIDSNVIGLPALIFLEKVKILYPVIKVIVVSGDELTDYATKATNLGAYSFIKKPYGLEECFNFISRCLDTVHGEEVQARTIERYRKFMEQSSLGILHLQENGEVLNVNDTFLEFFPGAEVKLIQYNLMKDLQQLLPESEYEILLECLAQDAVFTSPELLIPKEHFFEPQDSMYFNFSLYKVDEKRDNSILVAMFFNNTEAVKSKEAESRALKVKSEFLAQMGHELRTPLNSILGYGDLIDFQADKPIIKEYAGHISGASKHLLELLNEILETSKIEFDNIVNQKSRFKLLDLFYDLRDGFQSSLSHTNIELEISFSQRVPEYVEMDRSKLRWLVDQIVHIALIYLKNQKIKLGVDLKDSALLIIFCFDKTNFKAIFLKEFGTNNQLQNRLGLKASIIESYMKALSGTLSFASDSNIVVKLPVKDFFSSFENNSPDFDETEGDFCNMAQDKIVIPQDVASQLSEYLKIGDVKSLEKELNHQQAKDGSSEALQKLMDLVKNFDLKTLKEVLNDNRSS
ncbi:MAG: response regulator [Candidatus Cloacimonetes bacterium]|nr:response regulator [Candidatus Cloacimonadota bacterium]